MVVGSLRVKEASGRWVSWETKEREMQEWSVFQGPPRDAIWGRLELLGRHATFASWMAVMLVYGDGTMILKATWQWNG